MGRRALQQNVRTTTSTQEPPTGASTVTTATMLWDDEDAAFKLRNSSAGPSNTSVSESPMPSPSPIGKALDRVLLERNLEKLLIDRG